MLPFAPRPAKRASPTRPPRLPKVRGSHLEFDVERAQRIFDEAIGQVERMDLDAEQAKVEEGVAANAEGAREARTAVLLLRACQFMGRGDVDRAAEEASAVIAEAPDYAGAYSLRATIHQRRGDTAAARADLDRTAELAPTDATAFFRRGVFHENHGDPDRALADFERAAHLDPQGADAHAGAARIRFAQGDHAGSIRGYGRAIKRSPRDPSLYYLRGIVYETSSHPELALADYSKSLTLDDNQVDVRLARGRCRLRLNKHEAAVGDFSLAIAARPDDGYGYRSRGDALLGLGRPAEALPDLDRAVALASDTSGSTYFLRGMAHKELGDHEASLRDLNEAVQRSPENVTFLSSRFAAHCELGHEDEPIADLDRLAELMPESAAPLLTRGRLLKRRGQRPEALADFTRAIEADPTCADAYYERGQFLVRGDVPSEGWPDLDRAFELSPGTARFRLAYGEILVHRSTGETRAAGLDHIAASPSLDAENADAWYDAGAALRRVACHDRAISMLDRALALDPTSVLAYVERAMARQGAVHRDAPEAEQRAACLAAIADYEAAMAHSDEDDAGLFESRGQIFEELGELDRALADFDKVVQLWPDMTEGYEDRGRVRRLLGDVAGAEEDEATAARLEAEWREENKEILALFETKHLAQIAERTRQPDGEAPPEGAEASSS